jgi:hypothetical protein
VVGASQRERDRLGWAILALAGLTVLLTGGSWPVLSATGETGLPLEAAIVLALAWAGLAWGWRAIWSPATGATLAALAGAALLSKPWLAPFTWVEVGLEGQVEHALSPTSETHLYFVIPGLGLLVVAGLIVAAIRAATQVPVAAPAAGKGSTGTGQDRIELPRPRPPGPPAEPADTGPSSAG